MYDERTTLAQLRRFAEEWIDEHFPFPFDDRDRKEYEYIHQDDCDKKR